MSDALGYYGIEVSSSSIFAAESEDALKWIARCLGWSLDGFPELLKMLLLVLGFFTPISIFSLRCWMAEFEYFIPRPPPPGGLFYLI